MKKNTFVNILQGLFYIALVGAAAFGIYYLFENKIMQDPTKEPTIQETEQPTANKLIFNENFVYQGFINNDSTQLSSLESSIVGEHVDEVVMNSGVDLKLMANCIVGELSENSADEVTMLIYFEEPYDTTNMFFDISGIDQITLHGETADETFEINLRYSEMTNIDVNSFMDKLTAITIVCNNYERLVSSGGTLTSRY